jgi:MerR family mercuric resistance operon transcriptional regulator
MHRPSIGASPPRGAGRLHIGELARRTGCNIDTIRYYEKIGLLPPPARTSGRFRAYGVEYVRRLGFIRRARELGFTIDQVRAMVRLADHQGDSCAEAKAIAAHHLADVRAKIADLRAMEEVLAALIAECETGRFAACPLIERLSRVEAAA